MLDKFEKVLDEKVRPQLALHRGGVEILSYEENILRIRLLGQCSGCPSAYLTTEELIAAEIKESYPEVKDVILVTQVSEELLDQARKLLAGRRQL